MVSDWLFLWFVQSSGIASIQTNAIQSHKRDRCTNCRCQDILCEGSEPNMYKDLINCDTCTQDAHSKDSYEHCVSVEELEKSGEKLLNIGQRLQEKEFESAEIQDHPPPPYTDVIFETPEGRKVYAHKAVLVSTCWTLFVFLSVSCQKCVWFNPIQIFLKG